MHRPIPSRKIRGGSRFNVGDLTTAARPDREIRAATHVAYFRKKGRPGQARRIVEGMLAKDAQEYPMEYPVTTELAVDSDDYVRLLADFYDAWAERLTLHDLVILLSFCKALFEC